MPGPCSSHEHFCCPAPLVLCVVRAQSPCCDCLFLRDGPNPIQLGAARAKTGSFLLPLQKFSPPVFCLGLPLVVLGSIFVWLTGVFSGLFLLRAHTCLEKKTWGFFASIKSAIRRRFCLALPFFYSPPASSKKWLCAGGPSFDPPIRRYAPFFFSYCQAWGLKGCDRLER
jgi:hypothetical protein